MALQESRGKLASNMRDLMALWSGTQVHWNDSNTEQIEQTVLRPLEMDLRAALSAMDEMAALLTSIRRQCE